MAQSGIPRKRCCVGIRQKRHFQVSTSADPLDMSPP
jgi:hypothetical protein